MSVSVGSETLTVHQSSANTAVVGTIVVRDAGEHAATPIVLAACDDPRKPSSRRPLRLRKRVLRFCRRAPVLQECFGSAGAWRASVLSPTASVATASVATNNC